MGDPRVLSTARSFHPFFDTDSHTAFRGPTTSFVNEVVNSLRRLEHSYKKSVRRPSREPALYQVANLGDAQFAEYPTNQPYFFGRAAAVTRFVTSVTSVTVRKVREPAGTNQPTPAWSRGGGSDFWKGSWEPALDVGTVELRSEPCNERSEQEARKTLVPKGKVPSLFRAA